METIRLLTRVSVTTLLVLTPQMATAQLAGRLVLTPYVGAYVPSNDVAKVGLSSSSISMAASLKHESGFAYGANASYWLTDRFAIEAGGLYATSDLRGSVSVREDNVIATEPVSDAAHVWFGSAKLMVQLLPPENGLNLRLGAGPAIVSRRGPAYKTDEFGRTTGLTNFGGAFSLCTRLPLSPSLGLRLRAEDYLYRANLGYRSTTGLESFDFGSRTQNDFVFSAGLQFSMR